MVDSIIREEYYSYARVSTDEQTKTGFSIDGQLNDVRRYIESVGGIVVREFKDDGYTAKNTNRRGLQQLIKAIVDSNADKKNIVIRHPNRLIRNIVYKKSLMCVFEKYNVEIHCISGTWIGDSVEEEVLADFTMVLDESESKRIPLRVMDGLKASAALGNYPLPRMPKGYKRIQNEKVGKGTYLVPDEEATPVIIKIFNTLATNKITVKNFAKYLAKNKVLNARWTAKMLYNIVDNRIYYGHLKTDWWDEEGHTIPLISKELWLETQKAVHRKKKNTYHYYLFNRMVYSKNSKDFCNNDCAYKTKRNSTEKVLYKYYKDKKLNKRIGEKVVLARFAKSFDMYKMNTIDEEYIDSLSKKIDKKKNRVEMLHRDYDNDLITEDYYRKQLHALYKSIKEYSNKIKTFAKDNNINFLELSDEKKRALIISYVDKIMVDFTSNTIEVVYKKKK